MTKQIVLFIYVKKIQKEEGDKDKEREGGKELELFEKLAYFWVFRKASLELLKVQGSVLVFWRKISERKGTKKLGGRVEVSPLTLSVSTLSNISSKIRWISSWCDAGSTISVLVGTARLNIDFITCEWFVSNSSTHILAEGLIQLKEHRVPVWSFSLFRFGPMTRYHLHQTNQRTLRWTLSSGETKEINSEYLWVSRPNSVQKKPPSAPCIHEYQLSYNRKDALAGQEYFKSI